VGEIAIVENEVTVAWFLGVVENYVAWDNSNARPTNRAKAKEEKEIVSRNKLTLFQSINK
jgi:hypothetical protein